MHKSAGHQAPPLATEGEGSVVSAPMDEILAGGIVEHGDAGKEHAEKHGDVDAEDSLRDYIGGVLPAQPGRGLDPLDGIVGLAALR